MIPISYRLTASAEQVYYNKVIGCFSQDSNQKRRIKKIRDFCEPYVNNILDFLDMIGSDQMKEIIRSLEAYNEQFRAWICMTYEQMDVIKRMYDEYIYSDSCQAELSEIRSDIITQLNEKQTIPTNDKKKLLESINLLDNLFRLYIFHKSERFNKNKLEISDEYQQYQKLKSILDNFFETAKKYDYFSRENLNNWIINQTQMKVCPYCNILYTYNREEVDENGAVTAQLDHFFSKSIYPMFALCFYNLVPSCGPCNHIKRNSNKQLTSPYQKNAFSTVKFEWDIVGPKDELQLSLNELEDLISLKIKADNPDDLSNYTEMGIDIAYKKHTDYAAEVLKKARIYNNPEMQKWISDVAHISNEEVIRFYLGNYYQEQDLKKRPLSKLARDICKQQGLF